MPAPPLRVAFFGTPELALPTLDTLLDGPHEVVCVVSQPDRGRGRGRARTPTPVAARALERGVPLLRPERVGDAEVVEALRDHAPDVGVVVAFGQFLPKAVRELPRLGYLINAHASLLPRHRGASPIQAAILAGDATTGISVMRVEKEMDAGAVMAVRETPIGPEEDAGALSARLARLAGEAIAEALDRIAGGRATWTEQDPRLATTAPRLRKQDGRLDWRAPTAALVRRIRALAPRPGAFTELPGTADGPGDTLRVLAAEALPPGRLPAAPPGTLHVGRGPDEPALAIATGDGWLAPRTVQRSGGRAMEIAAYLRGRAVPNGARIAGPDPGHATPPGEAAASAAGAAPRDG